MASRRICNPPSKNVRPIKPGGFVIPQQKEKHTPLLRISNPQSLKRLGHFLTPDFNALMTEISANIAEGNKVVLDNFGSFKLGIRTSPAVSAKKFTSANIKAMYIIYSPYSVMDQGKRVKPMLSGIKMEEMTEYNGIEDKENGGGTSGGGTSGGTDKDNTGDTSGGTDKDNPSGGNTPSGDSGKDNTGDGEGGGGDNVNF